MSYDTPADPSAFHQPQGHDGPASETAARPSTSNAWLSPWRVWRERRMTVQCCRQLVEIHDRIARGQPWLSGRALYLHVVAETVHGDFDRAERMLRFAEHSYAIWPTERPLNFIDVVHYLVVMQCQTGASGDGSIVSDIRPLVEAQVGRLR